MQYGYCVECDGWRRRPSLWPAHNVLYQQHVDLWWIYPTKPEAGVYKLQPILQWNSFNFYSSSRMFLSCNLCMIFEFISVVLQIVIPGCLYQLNLINLNELNSCLSLGLTLDSDKKWAKKSLKKLLRACQKRVFFFSKIQTHADMIFLIIVLGRHFGMY